MSCYWDIICVPCNEWAGFSNANHADEAMVQLVAHAEKVARLHEMVSPNFEISLSIDGHHVPDLEFFAKHRGVGHSLRAVDEYGRYDTLCPASFICPQGCGVVPCSNREHPLHPDRHEHVTAQHLCHWSSEVPH